MVEQRFCKPSVVGSNPTTGSNFDFIHFIFLQVVFAIFLGMEVLTAESADFTDEDSEFFIRGIRVNRGYFLQFMVMG